MTETLPVEIEEMATKSENRLNGDKSRASLFLLEKLSSNQDRVVNAIANRAGKLLKMDKAKALVLVLEKISAHQKVIASQVTEKMNISLRLSKSRVVPMCLMGFFLFTMSQGHCADPNVGGLETVTTGVMGLVFGGGIKKCLLVFAAAGGLAQSFFTGSYKPLMVWGGLGLAYAYVPKLVDIISNIG